MDKYYLEETSKDVKTLANKFVNNFKTTSNTEADKTSHFDISYKKNTKLKIKRYKAPRSKVKFNRSKKIFQKGIAESEKVCYNTFIRQKIGWGELQ